MTEQNTAPLTAQELAALSWLPVDGSERVVNSFDVAIGLCNLEAKGLADSMAKGSRVLPLRWRITEAGMKRRGCGDGERG